MDDLPSYNQAAADSAAPEYAEPDPDEQDADVRIASRRGKQNSLAAQRYGDAKALLDLKVQRTSGSANKRLLESWRDDLLRRLRKPEEDDSFNFYTTSNWNKIDQQIRTLMSRNLTETPRFSRSTKVKDKYKASTVVKELHLEAPESIRFVLLHHLIRRIAAQADNHHLQGVTEAALTQVLNRLCVTDWNFRHRENWLTIWDEFWAIHNWRETILNETHQVLEEYKPETFVNRLHLKKPSDDYSRRSLRSRFSTAQRSLTHHRIARRYALEHGVVTYGEAEEGGLRFSPK